METIFYYTWWILLTLILLAVWIAILCYLYLQIRTRWTKQWKSELFSAFRMYVSHYYIYSKFDSWDSRRMANDMLKVIKKYTDRDWLVHTKTEEMNKLNDKIVESLAKWK